MVPLFSRMFDSNDREIKRLSPIISEINSFEEKMKKLKDSDFAKKTKSFKEQIAKGDKLETILPEAFALVREASRRATGMRHFDVQLMAATILSGGKIAEQKTGEGKTLSAIPALYLNSLTGKSVHLVTVNDYLARRDAGWMGPIFQLLGVSVASMINERSFLYDPTFKDESVDDFRLAHLRPITRKEAYQADVVYGINSEFGFDYLRDNMAPSIDQVVQRDFYYAIVDEVDSVLIDEARTPHIISAPDEAPSAKYYDYAQLVEKLSSDTDYKIDEKMRTAHLTDHGIGKIEKLYGVQNIYEKDFDTVYHIEAALKARTLFHKEKEYIVRDNEVILVDEFTGRLMPGRRLSDGIHQALEAKERVPIQRESKTLATVSLQNYFRMYEKLAGMTGTALTEAEEFNKIYKLDVVVIPTNNPVARDDASDAVYKTGRAKLSAVVLEVENVHKTGQPILIGTTAIDKNEIISELLKRKGIKHEVLNAKNHVREAEIIAEAGKKGAVTVATNMAGRGVDIVLGGESPKKEDGTADVNSVEYKKWKKNHDEVVELGGLYVIGTERHESRRIDNQLRGRSGRQGDPGKSQFFVALDDEIMRLFGGDRIAGLMTRFNMPEDVPLSHGLVSKAIENAQVKVEGFNFDIRKHLVEYDDVLNKQREIIYKKRREVLNTGKDDERKLKKEITDKIGHTIGTMVTGIGEVKLYDDTFSVNDKILEDYLTIINFDEHSQKHLVQQLEQYTSLEQKAEFLTKLTTDLYEKREKQWGKDVAIQAERYTILSVIDKLWMSHLDTIDNLREGIRLQGYAQKDPLVEYKNQAYSLFEKLIYMIDDEIVHLIFKIAPQGMPLMPQTPEVQVTNTPESEISNTETKLQRGKSSKNSEKKNSGAATPPQPIEKNKLGRNDPCWCGSGKKFKKCHWPNFS